MQIKFRFHDFAGPERLAMLEIRQSESHACSNAITSSGKW
jgi:hypothetical protein